MKKKVSEQPADIASDQTIMTQTIQQLNISRPEQAATTRQKAIGAGLRQLFNEVMDEPVPTQFLELMDELERQDCDAAAAEKDEEQA